MTMESILYPKKIALGAGIVGGIAGGAVMYGIMSMVMTQIGMVANCFAIIMGLITGQSYENALGPGITAHFLTSVAIGVAFGAVITTKKLQIRGFGKGIGLGVATGVIAYVVIFLPIAMTALPPHMMDIMKMMPMGNMEGNMQSNSMNEQSQMQGNSMSHGQMSNNSEMNQQGTMAGNTIQGKGTMDKKMKMEQMDKMITEQTQKLFPMILAGSLVSHIAFGAVLGTAVTPIVKRAAQRSGR
ncbi:MAG: hypothetical protein KGI33_09170 [Thaumarchaeota archaeon]|nr:hypothetical protein [Nitrososphaerota archaeon]